jgi:hypothetical protein
MIKLQLPNHKWAIVDDDAPEEITAHKWQYDGRYAMRFQKIENGKFKKIYLHIAIAKPERGMIVDHKDQNPLNCRKDNLRVCTHSQNMQNRKPKKGKRYKGVAYLKKNNKYSARITANGKTTFLGLFVDAEKAAKAYDAAAVSLFGEFARLNTYD